MRCHWNGFGRLSLVVLVGIVAGCASLKTELARSVGIARSVPALSEPEKLPAEMSGPPQNAGMRSDVSVVFDYSNCSQSVLLTEDTPWGTVVSVASVPLRDVVRRQFESVFAGFFRSPGNAEGPDVAVNVVSTRTILKKSGQGSVRSDIEFSVNMTDSDGQTILPSKRYQAAGEGRWDGSSVPLPIYQCAHEVACKFFADISKRHVVEKLEGLKDEGVEVREPVLLAFEMKPSSEPGVFSGSCRLACNDWDASRAANWLRTRLDDRAQDQLGVPLERVRVIYEENVYDAKKSEWHVRFKAFARVPWFLEYDRFSRTGVCAADLELARLSAQQGAEKMKEYVMQEMNRRGIVYEDGKPVDGAGVRFDEFKTDKRYNIISCAFRLIK